MVRAQTIHPFSEIHLSGLNSKQSLPHISSNFHTPHYIIRNQYHLILIDAVTIWESVCVCCKFVTVWHWWVQSQCFTKGCMQINLSAYLFCTKKQSPFLIFFFLVQNQFSLFLFKNFGFNWRCVATSQKNQARPKLKVSFLAAKRLSATSLRTLWVFLKPPICLHSFIHGRTQLRPMRDFSSFCVINFSFKCIPISF